MMSLRYLMLVVLVLVSVCYIGDGKPTKKKPQRVEPDVTKLGVAKVGFKYMKNYYRESTVGGKTVPIVPAPDNLETVVSDLQRMVGLDQTGEIDEPTARAMAWPRCGVHDTVVVELSEEAERKKRYVISGPQFKWDAMDLTYKIENYPNQSVSEIKPQQVDEAVATAFKLWSDATPLTFTRVPPGDECDIALIFGKDVHTDVDGDPPFDGPGGTLAHAFTPNSGWDSLNGDVHYDDEEKFTHEKYYGRNLLYVTAHELGHSLGLDHSNTRGALMWPFILSYSPNYQLPEDDKRGIQSIYGENPNPPAPEPTTPAPPVTQAPAPRYCDLAFTDVAIIRGELYTFHKKKFWRFSLDGHLIEDGSLISSLFKGVTVNLDGIVERWYDEHLLLVKHPNIYEISGASFDQVTQRPVSDLGIPRNTNCSMHRASDGTTFYFKKHKVYMYNEFEEAMDEKSPRAVHNVFKGVPEQTRVSAAFTGTDGFHNLLVGTEFYKVEPNLRSDGVLRNFGEKFLRCPPA